MYIKLAEILDENDSPLVEILEDIKQDEIDELYNSQKSITEYKHIKHLYDITISNGNELFNFLDAVYGNKKFIKSMKVEKILLEGNRLIANYCSFIGMIIDQIEKVLTRRGNQKLSDFRSTCSQLYDEKFEYRFIILLRNFITHYSLPFVYYKEDFQGKRITFNKYHLLRFSKWKHVKNELEHKETYIDFQPYIQPMNVNISVLFYTFIYHLSADIINAYQKMNDFIIKHRVKHPAIVRYETLDDFKQGKMSCSPIDIKDLKSAFCDVKFHPEINVTFSDIKLNWLKE